MTSLAWAPLLALLAYLLVLTALPALLLVYAGNAGVLAWRFRGELLPFRCEARPPREQVKG
jgi:hypothetical protein